MEFVVSHRCNPNCSGAVHLPCLSLFVLAATASCYPAILATFVNLPPVLFSAPLDINNWKTVASDRGNWRSLVNIGMKMREERRKAQQTERSRDLPMLCMSAADAIKIATPESNLLVNELIFIFWSRTKQTVCINNKCNNQLYHIRFRADSGVNWFI